jgi:hypothetical protein
MLRIAALSILLFALASGARAHSASDAFLRLRAEGATLAGEWDAALRDLDLALGLDANGDGALTWGELRAREPDVAAHLLARLRLASEAGPCATEPLELLVDEHATGAYAVLRFRARCPSAPATLRIRYDWLFDLDPQHRGIARVATGAGESALVFSPESREQEVALADPPAAPRVLAFGREGVHHIWSGTDHLLFLLTLLLPAALAAPREGVRGIVRIVSAFTLAHSLTLSLAALGFLALPGRLVESAIALSVLVAALANLRWPPLALGARFAFGFGLVHGLGFASALGDLGLGLGARIAALLGFNAGVELGQLAVVAGFLPVAWLARETWFYRRVALAGGSLAIAGLACVWLAERSLG